MGNNSSDICSFDLNECGDLIKFLSFVNMIDGFNSDTCLSISSKCLYIINNLINNKKDNAKELVAGLEYQQDDDLINKIERLKFQCSLVRHIGVVNSATESVEEWVELNNVGNLLSLTLDHIPIRYVLHLKRHRQMLLRLSLHHVIENLESVINLCGGDHSFPVNWSSLLHLDIRYNHLKAIDNSVEYLTALNVLDISRNDVDDLAFIEKIPTLECLNASFNNIRFLPHVMNTRLHVLILAYNFIEGLEGITSFKFLSTLNISYNIVANSDYLHPLKRMDFLNDLVLRGNPICCSEDYRKSVLGAVSPRVSINFALDGKSLTKKENIYLHKSHVKFIPPPLPPSSLIPGHVTVIVVQNNERSCDLESQTSDIPGNRVIKNPGIEEHVKSRRHREKMIDNLSESEKTDFRTLSLYKQSRMESLQSRVDSYIHLPNYIGEKSSNLLIAYSEKVCRSFTHISVQIFEHRLMAVDEFDVTVDNVDLWMLMGATNDTLSEGLDSGNVLKLIFFVSCNPDDCTELLLSTRTIEFYEVVELKKFLYELSLYLQDFTLSHHDWPNLPLKNMYLKCTKCSTKAVCKDNNIRPFICQKCLGTSFILHDARSWSHEDQMQILDDKEKRNRMVNFSKQRSKTAVIQGSKSTYGKSPTSDLIINTLKSPEIAVSSRATGDEMKYANVFRSLQELNESHISVEFKVPDTVNNDPCHESLNFDYQVDSIVLDVDQKIVPRDLLEDNVAYARLKSSLNTPWVVHEDAYNIKMYMHDARRIDDRLKLHLLTKVMHSQEDLLFVFKVFFVYRSAGMATVALLVISNIRVIILSLVDIQSSNLMVSLKFIYEFQLNSLQQLEYCLNNQWLELQFKGKPTFTIMVGDSECVKGIGISIAEAVSQISSNFSVIFSKEIKELKCTNLLSIMTNGSHEGVTLEGLNVAESYLIRSSTVLPITEKSSLEYAPKMIVIECNHLFFVTFTYTSKSPLPTMDLTTTVPLYTVMKEIIVDTLDDCILRLTVTENEHKTLVDIKFLSPHSRSKAGQCIAKFWKDLFKIEMMFIEDNLSAE